jgi:hypothetical protein
MQHFSPVCDNLCVSEAKNDSCEVYQQGSSLALQVATVCANDETFIQTCNRIACPPTEGACTPGTPLSPS